jgi:hypothetical protein
LNIVDEFNNLGVNLSFFYGPPIERLKSVGIKDDVSPSIPLAL